VDWCTLHLKQIDEDVDKDTIILEEQAKMLKNLRYEKDFWKELELKSVIGDEIVPLEQFCLDVDDQLKHARNQFNASLKELRTLIDKECFADIITIMRHLAQAPEEPVQQPLVAESPCAEREPSKPTLDSVIAQEQQALK